MKVWLKKLPDGVTCFHSLVNLFEDFGCEVNYKFNERENGGINMLQLAFSTFLKD